MKDALLLAKCTEPLVEGHALEEMSRTFSLWKTLDGQYFLETYLWDIDHTPETHLTLIAATDVQAWLVRLGAGI